MPAVVHVLDKSFSRFKKPISQNAQWLLKDGWPRVASAKSGQEPFMEVYLVGDALMKKNVLSFQHLAGFPRPDIKQRVLGEIYLNPKYIKEHKENLTFMLIHGFLHLQGYDHIKKNDRMVMEKLEAKLLSTIPHQCNIWSDWTSDPLT